MGKEDKVEPRPVTVGDWIGNDWFIMNGLQAGDQVVVDGGLALRPGEPVSVKSHVVPAQSPVTGTTGKVETAKADLDKGGEAGR